ncbi:beta-carotene ketolase (CrtW type) [Tangfeifania diversioriginum]|uniref:Beta-carotene ketolase (CrtW type) n=1 Tax=Tangfeifania diversioriginum TaxID=1168035 RepID=A0A1M6L0M3_9BACT|nr:fatty acid desaturase [Tangfeifania diversioriginum]SHJ64689.1 beta-carotene ketolase (CrtW type) [Tangfeifania diversioriginum]
MGVFVAIVILIFWLGHLLYSLFFVEPDLLSPFFYLHILIQAYLYTGLFITAHDSMHGTVAKSRRLNNFIGHLSTTLFAFLSYNVLRKKHYQHHRFPGTEKDPDFSPRSNNFFVWWFVFMKNYVTWWQILLMAIAFNVLLIWFSEIQLIAFWVIPAILATFQLFFFGTYLPHRRPHSRDMEPHKSRTQRKNHLWAMLSCYFFGYHHEHHESPTTPWWQLYKSK